MTLGEIIKNKRFWMYLIVTVVAVILIALTCRKVLSRTTESERDGYKTISDVPGVTFAVKKDIADFSTAVMEISPNMEFVDYQTYSYKNGKDTYLLFNIRNYIVIVKKGTSFSFAENEINDSLEQSSLNGIWFETKGKNPVLYAGNDRYEVSVTAQVVITNAIYNDFNGILTTIVRDGVEWSMFAGSTKTASEEYTDIMEYISSTFTSSEDKQEEKVEFAISADGNIEKMSESQDIIITEVADNTSADNITLSPEPTTTSEPIETAESAQTPAPSPEVTEEPIVVPEPAESESPKDLQEEENPVAENMPENNKTKETVNKHQQTLTIGLNQKQYEREQDKAYTSSIYSMMSLGTTGYMDLYWDNGEGMGSAFIHANRVYDAEETKTLIANYCASGESYYGTFEAPPGTHFEAVEYSVNFLGKEPTYVNIVLCGMDGENLRYRGILYSGRTYDILSNVRAEGDWYVGYIAFYAVPNGCKEYALKCGSVADESTGYLAYYKIGK